MRYSKDIGQPGDYVERKFHRPRLFRCPHCGTKGRRIKVVFRWIAHVGLLNRRSWIQAEVGVYKAKCGCCRYFQAPIPGVPYRGQYSYEVRNTVANAVVRDRMPYRLVQQRMAKTTGWTCRWAISTIALSGRIGRLIRKSTGRLS